MQKYRRLGQWAFRLTRAFLAYDRVLILERDLTVLPEVPPPSIDVEYRLATPQDLATLTSNEHGYDEDKKRGAVKRLGEGDVCCIAVHEDRVVGIRWSCFKEFNSHGIRLPLGQGWVFGYRLRTVERYRRKGISTGLRVYMTPILREMGAVRNISTVELRNEASLLATTRLGSEIMASIYTALLLRKWRISSAPANLAQDVTRGMRGVVTRGFWVSSQAPYGNRELCCPETFARP